MPPPRSPAYWKANNRLIVILLLVWAMVSLGAGILFVEPLNKIQIGQVPLGFWMAQQGSIYIFVILIFIYAFVMDRLDKKHLPAAIDLAKSNAKLASLPSKSAPATAPDAAALGDGKAPQ